MRAQVEHGRYEHGADLRRRQRGRAHRGHPLALRDLARQAHDVLTWTVARLIPARGRLERDSAQEPRTRRRAAAARLDGSAALEARTPLRVVVSTDRRRDRDCRRGAGRRSARSRRRSSPPTRRRCSTWSRMQRTRSEQRRRGRPPADVAASPRRARRRCGRAARGDRRRLRRQRRRGAAPLPARVAALRRGRGGCVRWATSRSTGTSRLLRAQRACRAGAARRSAGGGGLYGGDVRAYVMDDADSLDVDLPFDLRLAELLLDRSP